MKRQPVMKLVPTGMVRTRPILWCGKWKWPWILSDDQRQADDNANRGDKLDIELLDRVLEERNIRTNAARKTK